MWTSHTGNQIARKSKSRDRHWAKMSQATGSWIALTLFTWSRNSRARTVGTLVCTSAMKMMLIGIQAVNFNLSPSHNFSFFMFTSFFRTFGTDNLQVFSRNIKTSPLAPAKITLCLPVIQEQISNATGGFVSSYKIWSFHKSVTKFWSLSFVSYSRYHQM